MASRPKVYLTQGIPEDSEGMRLLREQCDITIYDESKGGSMAISRDEFLRSVKGVDAIFLALPAKVDADVLDTAGPQLKVVGTQSVGLDHVDLKECARRNIPVGYTPDVLTDAVAENTVALTLATARRYKEGLKHVSEGKWGSTWDNSLYLCGKEIKGSVVGIVGLGRIGFAVAKRLKSFEVSEFLYCDRNPKDYATVVDAEHTTLNDLLERSDFVIACCSSNPSNQKLFNADAFRKMKRSAIFINTSRGTVVDQDALYEALVSNQIGAAGLDVTSPEPIPTNHPLVSLNNCTIIPHLGSASVTARHAMTDLSVRNILAGLKGQPLLKPAPLPKSDK